MVVHRLFCLDVTVVSRVFFYFLYIIDFIVSVAHCVDGNALLCASRLCDAQDKDKWKRVVCIYVILVHVILLVRIEWS